MKIRCDRCGQQFEVVKLCGYRLDHLVNIAERLDNLGYGPEKLGELMAQVNDSLLYAYLICHEEIEKAFKQFTIPIEPEPPFDDLFTTPMNGEHRIAQKIVLPRLVFKPGGKVASFQIKKDSGSDASEGV